MIFVLVRFTGYNFGTIHGYIYIGGRHWIVDQALGPV